MTNIRVRFLFVSCFRSIQSQDILSIIMRTWFSRETNVPVLFYNVKVNVNRTTLSNGTVRYIHWRKWVAAPE